MTLFHRAADDAKAVAIFREGWRNVPPALLDGRPDHPDPAPANRLKPHPASDQAPKYTPEDYMHGAHCSGELRHEAETGSMICSSCGWILSGQGIWLSERPRPGRGPLITVKIAAHVVEPYEVVDLVLVRDHIPSEPVPRRELWRKLRSITRRRADREFLVPATTLDEHGRDRQIVGDDGPAAIDNRVFGGLFRPKLPGGRPAMTRADLKVATPGIPSLVDERDREQVFQRGHRRTVQRIAATAALRLKLLKKLRPKKQKGNPRKKFSSFESYQIKASYRALMAQKDDPTPDALLTAVAGLPADKQEAILRDVHEYTQQPARRLGDNWRDVVRDAFADALGVSSTTIERTVGTRKPAAKRPQLPS